MAILNPINLMKWVEENRELLKPPVGNKVVYKDTDFIIMVVGGPNCRKDFHYNEGEEFFYQLVGDMELPIIEDGKVRKVTIKEGEIFMLPPRVPHSPQRRANTVGLVVERRRTASESDSCMWFCESCNNLLHKATFHLDDIVGQLPLLMQSFYDDLSLRTCNKCGAVMEVPVLENNENK
jgi:3-hydroxyanthranilate 3,4-dioxygenase